MSVRHTGGENNMSIIIEEPGIFTTIQDNGRFNYEKFGVSPSGPMDFISFRLANILAGNKINQNSLEFTLSGGVLRFDNPCVIAITGADMSPTINSIPCAMYQALQINSGDVLRMGYAKDLCRTYIAFHGGIEAQPIMGSISTSTYNHIGSKLRKGDVIKIHESETIINLSSRKINPPAKLSTEKLIRVILGPQDYAFTQQGINDFLSSPYKVTSNFDRMGYRLEGKTISHVKDANIISDGMVTGAIQVPGSGQPIIMMSERQTIGGYTKIACVITADLPLIGQSKEGDILRFKAVTIKEAHEELRRLEDYFGELEEKFSFTKNYRIKVNGQVFNVSIEKI